jgi:endonuclease-3
MDTTLAMRQLRELKKLVSKHEEKPRLAAEGWNKDWQTLIAIMLSAQTRDTKTIEVCNKLFKKYTAPEKLGNEKLSEIENQIRSINYYKTKARHIKETAQILSKIEMPESIEELMKLPGVGRKTANVFLVESKNAPAIGVDTHVSRIAIKLGWTNKKFEDKLGIERDLQKLFSKRDWSSINYILVTFGQTYGRSRKVEDEILEKFVKNITYHKQL